MTALRLLRLASTDGRRCVIANNVTALTDALAERPDVETAPDLLAISAAVDYGALRSEGMRLAVVDPSRRQTLHLRDLMIDALGRARPAVAAE